MNRSVSKTDEENKEANVSGQGASIDMDSLIGE